MDFVADLISSCRHGLAMLADHPGSLPAALLLAGLGGSFLHCVGMCGPFVLGQVVADVEGRTSPHYGEWHRLAGAALAPYHLGRLVTYTVLGAVAGSATSLFASTATFDWISGLLLAVAACLMLLQAFGIAIRGSSALGSRLAHLARPLSSSRSPAARLGLGLVLGFLPCGLLYGALAAAAGTASARDGALAMAAFGLGTVPALIAVGWGGVVLRHRLREAGRWIAAPLLVANAALMIFLATGRLG